VPPPLSLYGTAPPAAARSGHDTPFWSFWSPLASTDAGWGWGAAGRTAGVVPSALDDEAAPPAAVSALRRLALLPITTTPQQTLLI